MCVYICTYTYTHILYIYTYSHIIYIYIRKSDKEPLVRRRKELVKFSYKRNYSIYKDYYQER